MGQGAFGRGVAAQAEAVRGAPDRVACLGELADLVVRVARGIEAHRFRDPRITPLGPLESMVLRHIDDHPGIGPSRIAGDLVLKNSNVSASLRSLETKGLVRREPDPRDERCVRLFTTDAARRSTARVRREWGRLLDARIPADADVSPAVRLLEALEGSPD